MDIAILMLLWVQLVLGLATLPFSLAHRDGSVMIQLSHWAQHIVTFQGDAAPYLNGVDWVFKAHIFLGLTLFVVFPFSRLVHIWSAPVGYVVRPYQLVRRRDRGARVA
jgi:nitrate reductase gamma subunit